MFRDSSATRLSADPRLRVWATVARRVSGLSWLAGLVMVMTVLATVYALTDPATLSARFASVRWSWFVAAAILLLSEGCFTAWRLRVFTPGPPSFRACLHISAWFVLFLVALPARVGEVAAAFLLKHFAGQSTAPALTNLLTQRALDLMFLIAVFLLLSAAVSSLPSGPEVLGLAIALFVALAIGVWRLEQLLALAANATLRAGNITGVGIFRSLARAALKARSWRRHYLTTSVMSMGFVVTLLKWLANLGGLALLLHAFGVPVGWAEKFLLAAAFNFLAVVPLQTVGGVGLSEVGLAGALVAFGLTLEDAVAISVLVRLVLIVSPLVFWSTITFGVRD
ncbi:MAG: lysylphosphatidylglycerol synthase transmembrane domain-containing protein [Pseudomonadota bacterium]